MDFVHRRHPEYSSEKLLKVGRIVTVIFMLLAVLWAPQIENFTSLFKYLQQVLAYAVPPVVCLFLFGTFWARANSRGANAAILTGIAAGIVLFIVNGVLELTQIHFLLVAPILFTLCSAAMIAGSLLAPPPSAEAVAQYLWTPATYAAETEELKGIAWYANYRYQSLLILLIVVWLLAAFW